MSELLHQLVTKCVDQRADSEAIRFKGQSLSYENLAEAINNAAAGLVELGIDKQDRIAVYLPKQFETVISFFATSRAGAVIVPVNPLLKSEQVKHILENCCARILITSQARLDILVENIHHCNDLHTIICIETNTPNCKDKLPAHLNVISWQQLLDASQSDDLPHRVIDSDIASILYTSGSTGKPKGVVLSHRNMVTGAKSVAQYLENHAQDRLLAVLPFSFDYGFSQLTTTFHKGASVVLMDYLLPRDVINAAKREKITGIAAVPPLWVQLSQLEWPNEVKQRLRYITNSGGAMPISVLNKLRQQLPDTQVFLMYGLTEAFRSSYLPPNEIEKRPESMGKAIPNAELMVVREDGTPCAPNEPGELVHRGSLVALGYWDDPEKTAERFKPAPGQLGELPIPEIAVWSGDTVRMDEDGYLYFIGRKDDMIKTSGYRVSPSEVEEVIYSTGMVKEVAALGVPHENLGQAIVIAATSSDNNTIDVDSLMVACKQHLPSFMHPQHIELIDNMPKNPNGKIDRKKLAIKFAQHFEKAE